MQASEPGSEYRDAIEAEAARLLARLNNSPTAEDEAAICGWLEADPRHAVAFARAEAAWENAERLKAADIPLPPLEIIVDEEQQRRLSRNIWIAAAAAVILFIIAAVVTVRTFNGIDRYDTAIGEIRDIALADGSALHLNSNSEVEIRFTDNGRKIRLLKGEMSINVAHDTQRPLDVEAHSAVIRAVGTAFNVRMRPSLVELTVTTGTVSVRSGAQAVKRVAAGSGAVIRPSEIALTPLDRKLVDQRTAWREHMVELDGETVEQASAEFNRYRAAPILIGDSRVSALRIGGRFRTTDSAQFLTALQMSLPVRAVTGQDGSVMLLYRDDGDVPAVE